MKGDDDLGHGVTLARGRDGGLRVSSPRLPLPLVARRGRVPGSAVFRGDELYEAVTRLPGGGWHLAPWRESESVRGALRLDADAVAGWAASQEATARGERRRRLLVALLPLSGFAPAPLQRAWARDLGFPAVAATTLSAAIEATAGSAAMLHYASHGFGGGFLAPGVARVLLFCFVEGAARLACALGGATPAGTVLLALPWRLAEVWRGR